MGRKKLASRAGDCNRTGGLAAGSALPDDAQLAIVFGRKEFVPASCISSAQPWREQIAQWHDAGVPCTTINSVLVRNHCYEGSYSSVYRLFPEASHPTVASHARPRGQQHVVAMLPEDGR